MLVSTIFLSALMLVLLLIKQKWKPTASNNLPPGPKRLPIIGNLHQLGDAPHRSLQRLAEKHGPLMLLQLGSVPTLVVSSADAAREIFKNHDIAFSNRPNLYGANKFTYNCYDIAFAPYGEYWREVRKIAILEVLTAKRVKSFQGIREEEVNLMVNYISNSAGDGHLVNLSDLTLLLSNSFVRRVAFGDNKKGESEMEKGRSEFQGILNETQRLLGGFCVSDFFPGLEWLNKFNGLEAQVERNFRELDKFYDKVLEEHLDPNRVDQREEDIVDVLLRLQKDRTQAISLTDEQIKGVLTDMFIAGTDTSAATLVWTMTELIKNPSVMRKAQSEVRKFATKKSRVEERDVPHLNYLKMVVKESLRIHPPVPLLLPRETTERCIIGGYTIPAKTRVFVNAKAIAMDPKSWKNPDDFVPERFSDGMIDFKGQNFEFLPFGVGRRICPGINFSMPLVELALANLLHRFDWSLPQGMRGEDIDMDEAFGITMHKKVPLCLVASPPRTVENQKRDEVVSQ